MNVQRCIPKFRMGRLVVTPGAMSILTRHDLVSCLARHLGGDWGDLDAHDRQVNEDAVQNGGRILSEYVGQSGEKFWIITEDDRSATTILLPNEN